MRTWCPGFNNGARRCSRVLLGNSVAAYADFRKPSLAPVLMARPVLLYPSPPLYSFCKVLLVFGVGLAGGWALARKGSNPSPSARISPDKFATLPLTTEIPRRRVFSETEGAQKA